MPKRKAQAVWNGSLQEGNGTMNVASGAYEGPYSFQSRFEEGEGTNPEELLAGAHAGCFSMALSGDIGRAGHEAESVETEATVHVNKAGEGFAIQRVDLVTRAKVPGMSDEDFQEAAEQAKENCPVSQLFKWGSAEITLDATLES
jgi:osmotically inducible protein OsmC